MVPIFKTAWINSTAYGYDLCIIVSTEYGRYTKHYENISVNTMRRFYGLCKPGTMVYTNRTQVSWMRAIRLYNKYGR